MVARDRSNMEMFRRRMLRECISWRIGARLDGMAVVIGEEGLWIDRFAKLKCQQRMRIVGEYHAVAH